MLYFIDFVLYFDQNLSLCCLFIYFSSLIFFFLLFPIVVLTSSYMIINLFPHSYNWSSFIAIPYFLQLQEYEFCNGLVRNYKVHAMHIVFIMIQFVRQHACAYVWIRMQCFYKHQYTCRHRYKL